MVLAFNTGRPRNRRRGGNLWFAGHFLLLWSQIKNQFWFVKGRGNVAEENKYATQIFRNIRAAIPITSVTRTAANWIMKFHRHVGRLQQAAHQPAENLPCHRCVCASGTKGPAFG